MLPPNRETGPAVGGDLWMAEHHGGTGAPTPMPGKIMPPGKAVLRAPFRRPIGQPTGDRMAHSAWNGGQVEPSRTFEDGSVLPGGQAPAVMGNPGAVVTNPAAAAQQFLRDLMAYRGGQV